MELYDFVTPTVLKRSRAVDDGHGLKAIMDDNAYPWDIRSDAEALYVRWKTGNLDNFDLLHGIDAFKKTRKEGGAVQLTKNLTKGIDRVSCEYVGAGALFNGQWFAQQICAIRDGAHGEMEAGIHGVRNLGAVSIVMSSGGYKDVDEGETVYYCGTASKTAEPSRGTKYMLETFEKNNPVRLLRSSAMKASNPYRPKGGLRYDGLYEITDVEVLDEITAMHRFKLVRQQGQHPIRYKGEEKRPTDQQLEQFKKIRKLLGLKG